MKNRKEQIRRLRNRKYMQILKTSIKKIKLAMEKKDNNVNLLFINTERIAQKLSRLNIIHHNKSARLISNLYKKVHQA